MEIVAGIVLLLLLGGSVSPGRVARAVEQGIRAAVPSAKQVEVGVRTASRQRLMAGDLEEITIRIEGYDLADLAGLRLVLAGGKPKRKGHIGRLVVEAIDGRVPLSLVQAGSGAMAGTALSVAVVRLEFEDVVFDLSKIGRGTASIAIHEVGPTRVTVELAADAMSDALSGRLRPLRDATISLQEPDRVQVSGTLDAFVPLPVQVQGRLVVQGDSQLVMTDPQVRLMGVALPGSVVRDLARAANPLLDLRQLRVLPVDVQLERVGVRGLVILAEGEVRFRRQRTRAPEASRTTLLPTTR
jgi:hypothetical protein